MAKYPGVSMSVTRRLPRYYRCLGELMASGAERISSREFAEIIGFTASQIRQDLNCFGGFGQQGYGYNIAVLHREIGKILSVDKSFPAVLIGAGNLGLALTNHLAFEQHGFKLIGVFDVSPSVIGKKVRNWVIQDVSELEQFCRNNKPVAAILCVPQEAAAEVADKLVQWGIKGFWNFTHLDLSIQYKDEIVVENVHLDDSLMTFTYLVSEKLEGTEDNL